MKYDMGKIYVMEIVVILLLVDSYIELILDS